MDSVRIIIVDDEVPVIEGLSVILKRSFPALDIAGSARNGKDAVQLILELRPELALIDIHMPGMSGLEVIREVRRSYRDCVFILVTAYERFDIARDAFGLGVYSYLLKPVRQAQLQETIEGALALVQQSRQQVRRLEDSRSQVDRSTALLRLGLISQIVNSELSSDLAQSYRSLLSIAEEGGKIVLVELPASGGDLDRLHELLEDQLQFRIPALAGASMGRRRYYLIPMSPHLELDLVQYFISCGRQAFQSWGSSSDLMLGVGDYQEFSRLSLSAREAERRLAESRRFPAREVSIAEPPELVDPIVLRDRLLEAAARWNQDHALETWERYVDVLELSFLKDGGLTPIQAGIIQIFTLLHYQARQPFGSFGEEVLACESMEDLRLWGRKRIKGMIEASQEARTYSPVIAQAMDHLERKFAEQITLEDLAAAVRVSASYLSRMFSEEVGATFTEILTELRVEAAKNLLSDPMLSIKEVSHNVGYLDPNYFGRVFKRLTGLTPSEYTERMGQ